MLKKSLSLLSIGVGVFLIIQVIMPLLAYKFWEMTSYAQNVSLVSPSPDTGNVSGVSIESEGNFPALISKNFRANGAPYKDFTISIPSINLEQVKVMSESNFFDTNLAQLPGTALPGEKGNVFITGHSSLPQLYSPSNFKTIFTHLPEIKKGDSIIIDAGGQRFTYIVEGFKIVDPKEVWVINPPDNIGRYLSLMTCVPPGLNIKRLVVISRLAV